MESAVTLQKSDFRVRAFGMVFTSAVQTPESPDALCALVCGWGGSRRRWARKSRFSLTTVTRAPTRATNRPNHHTIAHTTRHVQNEPFAAGGWRHHRREARQERPWTERWLGAHIVERQKRRARSSLRLIWLLPLLDTVDIARPRWHPPPTTSESMRSST
jgi:hypothetical protein